MGNFRPDSRGGSRNRFGGGRSSGGFGGRGGFGRGRDSERRLEMHDAICSKCNKECRVPFKPTGSKPVLCSDCFRNKEGGNSFSRNESPQSGASSEQFKQINAKLDRIIKVLQDLEMDSGEDSENKENAKDSEEIE